MILIIWLVAATAALALYVHQVYSKLSRAQVNHIPVVPLFGHMMRTLFRTEHMVDTMMRNLDAFPEDRFVGHYEFFTPTLMIKDLELIKKITVKDFDYFVDRRGFIGEADPLFGRSLLSLKGEEWKAMRATLSPAFTSSKIRLMVPFMVEVGDQMMKSLKKKIKYSGKPYIDVEAKDLATRYANDVIASCAFGLKVESHDDDNQFYTMCKNITSFSLVTLIKVFTYRCFPVIAKLLNIKLASKEANEFFTNVVINTMKNRDENNIIRNDMIHLLMQAKKGQLFYDNKEGNDKDAGFATVEESAVGKKQHKIEWTDTDLIAQAVLFLFAGFDTVSTTMSFLLHELALNPDVQERLVQEIRDNDAKNGNKFDYNSVQNLTYLDMVVSESLRLWPGAPLIDRACVKEYNLGKPNRHATKDYIARKGELVGIPIWAFHRDPKYFPDPLKFDPERFSEEKKHNIKPFSYMPFGLGPRNCIASRFALCEVKLMLYQILQQMEVYPCEKTCIPTKLATDGFNMRIRGGAWIRMKFRD